MPAPLPGAVILDIRSDYQRFTQEAQPYLMGTETTPSSVVETLLEAMFDLDSIEERLLDTIVDLATNPKYTNSSRDEGFEFAIADIANTIRSKIEHHGLYSGRGYLPFNGSVEQNGVLVLRPDKDIDKTQQEWLVQEGMEDTDDLKTEYIGKVQ